MPGTHGLEVLPAMSPALLLQSIRTVHAQSSLRAIDRLLRRETGMRRIAGVLSPAELNNP